MHPAEIGAVAAGIFYVVLAARESIWCWLFGIVGSILSIYLFIKSQLYAEAGLYGYYVLAGLYGWYSWAQRSAQDATGLMRVRVWPWTVHVAGIVGSIGLAWGLAYFLRTYTDAQQPLLDAHTTIFSFWATYLVTRKVLENWLYWVLIDAFSVWLYASRELYLYALLMVAYTIIALVGFWQWRRHYRQQSPSI